MQAADLFTLPPSLASFASFFSPGAQPWEWVKQIAAALASLPEGPRPTVPPGLHVEGRVWIDPSVILPPFAVIIGPAFIGAGTEIRPGAYVRGNVVAGAGCVLGNSCEFKNCLLLDGVQVPHFSYVGDSVLGNAAHLGAGVILSNLRLDQKPISVRLSDGPWPTGMRKLGALLGDGAEVGCNAVLQPGTILGRRSLVMPTLAFGGTLAEGSIARQRVPITVLSRRD